MSNNDKIKKSIIESIIVIFIMVSYIGYGINFLPLLILFTSILFVVLGVRNGININIISIFIVSLIVSVLLGVVSGVSLILIVAPLSIALNYCIKTRKTTMETILISTGTFFISFLASMFLEGKVSGFNTVKQIEEIFMQMLSMQIGIYKEMGMTNYELLQIRELLEDNYKTIIILIPSLLVIFSLIVSYANLFLSSVVLRRMGFGITGKQKFSRFKLPANIVPGIGVLFLTAFIFKKMELGYNEAFLLNLTFLTIFAFFIQGLAVIDFVLIKAKMKLFYRILILSINIIFIPMSTIIGLLDTIFDLRKLRKQKSL